MKNILHDSFIEALEAELTAFLSAKPYPHCAGNQLVGKHIDCFEAAIKTVPMRRHLADFYSQYDAVLSPEIAGNNSVIQALIAAPNCQDVLEIASILAGSPCTESLVVIHYLGDRDEIEIHNDANDHGEKLRLCWMLGERNFSGGEFCIHPNAKELPIKRIPHQRDSWVLFRIGNNSYHSVSQVHSATKTEGRWTVIFTWGARTESLNLNHCDNSQLFEEYL